MPKPFNLENWYASEAAKRALGGICQAVNDQGKVTRLLGTPTNPLLILVDANGMPELPGDVSVTIDEAKADWPAVTTAAAIYETRFRIQGKKVERAVMYKNSGATHPAERYRISNSPEVNRIADQIEALANEVRKLGHKLSRSIQSLGLPDLHSVTKSLEVSADVIERRFREVWRDSNDRVCK